MLQVLIPKDMKFNSMLKWYLFFRYHLGIYNEEFEFVMIHVECGCLIVIVL